MENIKASGRSLNKPARAFIWYTASSLLSRGISLLLTPLITHLLPPEEYGIYTLYTSWLGIMTVIGTLEICGGFMYTALSEHDGDGCDILLSALLLISVLCGTMLSTYIIFKSYANGIIGLGTRFTVMLVLQVLFDSALNLSLAYGRYRYSYVGVCLASTGSCVLPPLLSVILIKAFDLSGEARIFASFFSSVLFAALALIYIFRGADMKRSIRERWRDISYLFKRTLPTLPYYISLSVMAHSDKVIMQRSLGDGAVGRYGVAFSVGHIFSLLTVGMSSALSPWLIRRLTRNETDRAAELLKVITAPLGILAVIFTGMLPELFSVIAAVEYREAMSAAYPTVIGVVFLFLCGLLRTAITQRRLITGGALLPMPAAAASVLLNLFLIPRAGYIGAGIASAASYMMLFFAYERFYFKKTGESLIKVNNCLLLMLFTSAGALAMRIFSDVFISRALLASALLMLLLPSVMRLKELVFEK